MKRKASETQSSYNNYIDKADLSSSVPGIIPLVNVSYGTYTMYVVAAVLRGSSRSRLSEQNLAMNIVWKLLIQALGTRIL